MIEGIKLRGTSGTKCISQIIKNTVVTSARKLNNIVNNRKNGENICYKMLLQIYSLDFF